MSNPKHVELTAEQASVLQVAFIVSDPCSDFAIELAKEVVLLIRGRDDADCVTLASELRVLRGKYPRAYRCQHDNLSMDRASCEHPALRDRPLPRENVWPCEPRSCACQAGDLEPAATKPRNPR